MDKIQSKPDTEDHAERAERVAVLQPSKEIAHIYLGDPN